MISEPRILNIDWQNTKVYPYLSNSVCFVSWEPHGGLTIFWTPIMSVRGGREVDSSLILEDCVPSYSLSDVQYIEIGKHREGPSSREYLPSIWVTMNSENFICWIARSESIWQGGQTMKEPSGLDTRCHHSMYEKVTSTKRALSWCLFDDDKKIRV
jgi:hypothetical protein